MNLALNSCPEQVAANHCPLPAPDDELLRLLTEWRRLTQCETRAIRLADWQDIAGLQRRKDQLQQAITEVLRRNFDFQAPGAKPPATQSPQLAPLVSELVILEAANRKLLAAQCCAQRDELNSLKSASHNLKGVRRAYGLSSVPHWQSYS